MRCYDCRRRGASGRFTLPRAPHLYAQSPRCPRCRSLNLQDCEESRRLEMARRNTCNCDGYPFPHEQGTLRFCDEHTRIGEPGTPDEIADYEMCLATPRSST